MLFSHASVPVAHYSSLVRTILSCSARSSSNTPAKNARQSRSMSMHDKVLCMMTRYLSVDNGIVTVHMAVARGNFRTLLDADQYLPTSWDCVWR